jgi:hypothetical protein
MPINAAAVRLPPKIMNTTADITYLRAATPTHMDDTAQMIQFCDTHHRLIGGAYVGGGG